VVDELRDLQQQIDEARSVLADLQRQTAGARRQLDFDDSAYLVEVNEQLIVSALQSQTEAEQAAQALGELSKSHGLDPLTQLPNRVQLQERFAHAIASAHRHRTRLAVLFTDIDGFKGINDALGHAAGDEVLKHAAHCIARSIRDVDFVCRYGGDEFVVLVTDLAQASDAAVVARKIESAVASPITVESRTMAVSLSIGVSIYPNDGAEPKVLIRCADVAMYEAKRLKMNSLGPDLPGAHGGA
jgi:diguanylate cyclase (GGDEF)-like protein